MSAPEWRLEGFLGRRRGETGVKGKEDLADRSGPLSGSGSEIPVVSKQ